MEIVLLEIKLANTIMDQMIFGDRPFIAAKGYFKI